MLRTSVAPGFKCAYIYAMRTPNLRLASLVLLAIPASARVYLSGSGGIYHPKQICNGTTYNPTGVTDTSPRGTKTTSRCVFTTTLLSYDVSTTTSSDENPITDLGAGPFINGDTLTPISSTATGTVTSVESLLGLSVATDFVLGSYRRQQYPRL